MTKLQEHTLIFKALVGSHSYGTNIEGSDEDYKGIYMQDMDDIYINGYKPQIEVSKDEVYYELRRFLSLCETGNPTVLELLFTPAACIKYKDPIFDIILRYKNIFLTKKLRKSFGGYAHDQISKARGLDKKMNYERNRITRKGVMDFCWCLYNGTIVVPLREYLEDYIGQAQEDIGLVKLDHMRDLYAGYVDWNNKYPFFEPKGVVKHEDISNDVSVSEVPKEIMENQFEAFIMYFNREAYSMHCDDFISYQEWLKNRNEQRYVDVMNHGQRIDGKNMLHCMRLIETALEIPVLKTIAVRRPNAQYLIDIRKGKYDLEALLEKAKERIKELDEVYKESNLPDEVPEGTTNKLMNLIVQEMKKKKPEGAY